MYDPEADADLTALRNIRRHLTVAFLAIEQLCRKTAAFPPAQQLCSFATEALAGIKDEVVGIEARLLRGGRRERGKPEETSDHPPGP